MDNINPDELRQITLFKDSVLNAADARRAEIISSAQQDSEKAIADAQGMCRLADHDTVARRLAVGIEQESSTATQEARRQLLAAREKMVEDMFDEVEKQLADFARKPEYGSWLAEKLAACPFDKGAAITVYLRGEDMPHAKTLKKALPGSTVQADETIRLGGLKVTDGHVLYDDTMDLALKTEKEGFYLTSGLSL